MSAEIKSVTASDIMPLSDYGPKRKEFRRHAIELKKSRRVTVGPFAEFLFESYQTMWQQIQEMLYIEKGGAAQLEEELAAYNPLIPQGRELVATLLLEIVDEEARQKILRGLGGIEHLIYVEIDGHKIHGKPDDDMVRTDEAGRTSSVHFIHFSFSKAAIDAFKAPDANAILGIEHKNYHHMAGLSAAVREVLSADFD